MTRTFRPTAATLAAGTLIVVVGCAAPALGGLNETPTDFASEPASFATILQAPASRAGAPTPLRSNTPIERLAHERGVSLAETERLSNPDEAATQAAMTLNRLLQAEAGRDYVGMRIVRDPDPRFAFQFRHNGAATLARFSSDSRFVGLDGGVPREELQPLFDEWWARFQPYRILGGGSVMEFDGEVLFDMTLDQASFHAMATREGWILPKRLRLNFPPPPNPRVVDPDLASQVRVFGRQDRAPGIVRQAALSGRLILRNGCFRLQEHGEGGEPLALFGRDVELARDDEGHMIVADHRLGHFARIGERVVWSGPRGVDAADAGVHALRAACGYDPIVAVGEPISEAVFEARLQDRR